MEEFITYLNLITSTIKLERDVDDLSGTVVNKAGSKLMMFIQNFRKSVYYELKSPSKPTFLKWFL